MIPVDTNVPLYPPSELVIFARVVFVGVGQMRRWHPPRSPCEVAFLARDFPANTERYVIDSTGYRNVIVNGEVLLEDGKHTGALPGHVLRGA